MYWKNKMPPKQGPTSKWLGNALLPHWPIIEIRLRGIHKQHGIRWILFFISFWSTGCSQISLRNSGRWMVTLQIMTTKLLQNCYKNVVIWILLIQIIVYYVLLYFFGEISRSSKCLRLVVVCSWVSRVRFSVPSTTDCSNFYNKSVVIYLVKIQRFIVY